AHLCDANGANPLELFIDDGQQSVREIAAVPFLRPMRRTPTSVDQLIAPFNEPQIGVPVLLQPGANLCAAGLCCHLGHAAVLLSPAISALSARDDRRGPREILRSFSPA